MILKSPKRLISVLTYPTSPPDPIPLDERNVYRFDSRLLQIERLSFLETSKPVGVNFKKQTKRYRRYAR